MTIFLKRAFALFALLISCFSLAAHGSERWRQEQTLSIIKPDAVAAHHIGDIIARFEKENLSVVALKMVRLTRGEAERFYGVHRNRPFFSDLVAFMTSGPIVVMVLQGKNAIAKNREIMGATDIAKAAKGSLRAQFGQSIERNAVHGSDSPEAAKEEISIFFKPGEIN